MRTLVHLSDLHFGRVDAALIEPLVAQVRALAPDLVVVSGDLTQRARAAQFRAARAFLDRLPAPLIVVPGNHDIPLHDVVRRFLRPLHRYRRYITPDLEPYFTDGEIAVAGINTARSLTLKGGRINAAQIARLRTRLCDLPPEIVRIIVTHHPFDLPPAGDVRDIVGRAPAAMAMFADCSADLLLSGHLHLGAITRTAARYRIAGYDSLVVQAGTATSTRGRGEVNSFNLLRIGRPQVEVQRYLWDAGARQFAAAAAEVFTLPSSGARA